MRSGRIILCLAVVLVLAAAIRLAPISLVGEEGDVLPIWPGGEMPSNRWVLLHIQEDTDPVSFSLQAHGGSCFDTKRGRLVLFGSDTHGRDWKNTPFFFEMGTMSWTRAYPDDHGDTYTVNEDGLPVAGADGDRPWAMHTFGSVVYDESRDEMVVCSYPAHMVPGRFTDALEHVWPEVERHPTWTYSMADGRWEPLACEAVHFFPYAAVYDTDRGVVIGYRDSGIWELGGEPRRWERVSQDSFLGWHNNAVYDSRHKALVVFGDNRMSDHVAVYRPGTGEHVIMPTPGERPPGSQHTPMCFDRRSGLTVAVVDGRAEDGSPEARTWLYDLGSDTWMVLEGAELPFNTAMNYTMEYDPARELCVLVASVPGPWGRRRTAVFALKVDKDAGK